MGKNHGTRRSASLRQRAESLLDGTEDEARMLSIGEVKRLIHELHVHQIELEMQNEELLGAQESLQEARDRFTDLYDFAPVAFLTVKPTGEIVEANLTASEMLGVPRGSLAGRRLSDFVSPEDQDTLHLQLNAWVAPRRILDDKDIRLERTNGTRFYVRLKSRLREDPDGPLVRLAMMDVTERKRADLALKMYHEELEQQVKARTEELRLANQELEEQHLLVETLVEMVADINSSLDLDEVLERILKNLRRAVAHDSASILLLEEKHLRLIHASGEEEGAVTKVLQSQQFALDSIPHLGVMLTDQDYVLIDSVREGEYWLKSPISGRVRSYVCAPIMKDGELFGILNVESFTPGFFERSDGKLVRAFMHHAALAIWNAYACMNRQEIAVSEERQRIAMELHDAVSQSLWSASIIAEGLPDLWEKDKEYAAEKTRMLQETTRGTLAEMRALLLEIRPTALETTPLDQSLSRLSDAIRSRSEAPIQFTVEGHESLPPEVRRTYYRVAQEALNNAVRHAQATQIRVTLKCRLKSVTLSVSDNGIGFDVSKPPAADRYGLSIMRERAESVGAALSIESTLKQGTSIQIEYKLDR